MKKLLVILAALFVMVNISYASKTTKTTMVWEYTAKLDSTLGTGSSSFTVQTQPFPFDADSLFVLGDYEETYGTSYTGASPVASTANDSITIEVKLQPITPGGRWNESILYTNTTANIFMDTIIWHPGTDLRKNIVYSGACAIAAHNTGFGTYRMWVQIMNKSATKVRNFHIKLYVVRKWSN